MDNLYQTIEHLCAKRGVNITQMCKAAGVPRSALSDYKAGRIKSLSTDKLTKIADYFNVSVDYLLGNEKKPAATEDDELNEYLEYLKNREDGRMLSRHSDQHRTAWEAISRAVSFCLTTLLTTPNLKSSQRPGRFPALSLIPHTPPPAPGSAGGCPPSPPVPGSAGRLSPAVSPGGRQSAPAGPPPPLWAG